MQLLIIYQIQIKSKIMGFRNCKMKNNKKY